MVKSIHVAIAIVCMAVVLAVIIQPVRKEPHARNEAGDMIELPEPQDSGKISVDAAMLERSWKTVSHLQSRSQCHRPCLPGRV